jgi:hypothetical protein
MLDKPHFPQAFILTDKIGSRQKELVRVVSNTKPQLLRTAVHIGIPARGPERDLFQPLSVVVESSLDRKIHGAIQTT